MLDTSLMSKTSTVFESADYKQIFHFRLKQLNPKKGVLSAISKKYRIPNSTLSQVFHGDRHLTPEQASDIAEYLELSDLETEYFTVLVDHDRAGTDRLRKRLKKKLDVLRGESLKIKKIFSQWRTLSDTDKFQFYSDWDYSAIHMLNALPETQDVKSIAKYLNLPVTRVERVVEFLIHVQMLEKSGERLKVGKTSTLISADDPLVNRHHQNWRNFALGQMSQYQTLAPHEASLTFPCVTSKEAMREIKESILKLISEAKKSIEEHEMERVAYLLVDWKELRGN